jgi:hypothetical protein
MQGAMGFNATFNGRNSTNEVSVAWNIIFRKITKETTVDY